jgi:hypothetical protein
MEVDNYNPSCAGGLWSKASWGKYSRLYLKNRPKKVGGMAQVVELECLSSKHEDLSSKSVLTTSLLSPKSP